MRAGGWATGRYQVEKGGLLDRHRDVDRLRGSLQTVSVALRYRPDGRRAGLFLGLAWEELLFLKGASRSRWSGKQV